LYQDKTNSEIFFTYSYWQDEKNLENYRNSQLFKDVWDQTKTYFNDKPLAWSLDKRACL
jgi:quinol monooxygenase YgiN